MGPVVVRPVAKTTGGSAVLYGARSFPRLAPSVIRRPRIEEWLGRLKGVPVRFLVAPVGFGKTTALVSYLRNCTSDGLYCSFSLAATAADVWAGIGAAIPGDGECATHDDVVRALAARAPVELALDFDVSPDVDGIAAIARLIDDQPEGVTFLIASDSRLAIGVARLITQGMASLCDAERLAFDVAEVRQLAEACKLPFTHSAS